jgi:hypothetical protein
MKKSLLFCLTITMSSFCFAQNNYDEVVYLKNGIVIRGMIIEQVPGKSLKIQTTGGNVGDYQLDEIEKITKEPRLRNSGINPLEPGHVIIAEVAYRFRGGIHGSQFVKLNLINSYRFSSGFSLGLGTGFKYSWHGRFIDIPFFADFRGQLNNKKTSPYWAFDVGYVFDASNKMVGQGLLLNPSAGVSMRLSDKTLVNVGLGYERQGATVHYTFFDMAGSTTRHYIYHSFTLNLGFTF